jgi:protein-disulfide isomerase
MARHFVRTLALSSFAALALAACGGGAADPAAEKAALDKVTAPSGKIWSDMAARTPDGGLLIGNPEAPIKLIEFASLTCGGCAQFSADSKDEIKKDFIDSGRVSFEVRHFLRNPIDLLAASIIQCAPTERQHALITNVFANQAELFAGAETGGEAAQASLSNQGDPARFVKAADAFKISAMFQSRGMAADQVNACLTNVAGVEKLVEDNNKWLETYKITGTPTFVLNGQIAEGALSWGALRDLLKAQGAR